MNKDRRQFNRWKVSIPCTITHEGETTKGKITNISQSGALITELTTAPPPEKAFITVSFKVEKEEVKIKASVDSRIVRKLFDTQEDCRASITFSGQRQLLFPVPPGLFWMDGVRA